EEDLEHGGLPGRREGFQSRRRAGDGRRTAPSDRRNKVTFHWWVSEFLQNGRYVELASIVFWMLFSITLHELAHGWAALPEGDDTPRRLGHLTANPLVHIPQQALLMFALCGIAWGLMPVNPMRFKHGRRGDIFVSAAGPGMNLLLAIACLVAFTAW